MEINTKQLAIAAAIGAAAWFLLRKKTAGASVIAATKPAIAPAPGTGDIWGGFGVGGGLMDAIGQAPAAKPAAAQKPAPAPVPVFGPGGGSQAAPAPTWDAQSAGWVQQSGEPVSEHYTFGHLTPEQRKGKTDGQLAISILGY